MQRHFDEELGDLKQKILHMGALVEDQVERAKRALIERNEILAKQVIDDDRRIARRTCLHFHG